MKNFGSSAPFIEKYEKAMAQNAHSRAFAPLAECYRKLGMIDKAFEILKVGLRHHPDYVLGLLSLAYCHMNNKNFDQAYDILSPIVSNNRENLRLQKLFAEVCLEVGETEESLETYKYLLFINPKDNEVALKVTELEDFAHGDKKSLVVDTEIFNIEKLDQTEIPSEKILKVKKDLLFDEEGLDDWNQVDLKNSAPDQDQKESTEWNLVNPLSVTEEAKPASAPLDEEAPFVTHTLVDLYCSQGHHQKAVSLLRQILLLNPEDQKSQEKLQEVLASSGLGLVENHEASNDEGYGNLMGIIDQTIEESSVDEVLERSNTSIVHNSFDYMNLIEKKLALFRQKLAEKAFSV